MKRIFTVLLAAALLLIPTVGTQAQDMGVVVRSTYFIAADENGVQQVYQLLLDGQSQPRQITRAASDVVTFDAAYDGLAIAYVSGGQLWLQPLHTEAAEALATLTATMFFSSPVFSHDGEYIAYADNGIWLVDLASRETRQLLTDVPLLPDGSNMAEMRSYEPKMFLRGADGRAAKLVVDVGIWEWNGEGIVDLATGALQLLDGQQHSNLLPLYGDRVLVYGNSGVGGDPALRFADSLDAINNSREVLRFSDLTPETLFAQQAVEIFPGVVRVFGESLLNAPEEINFFYVDVNLMESTVGAVQFVRLPQSTTGSTVAGRLSPDGSILPVYVDAIYTEFGTVFGALSLVDLTTGETISAAFPDAVGIFRWQR